MILILIYALMISKTNYAYLLNDSSGQSTSLHFFCHNLIPKNSTEQEALSALMCAEKITDAELNFLLGISGLIHIFVVSGAQLNSLRFCLKLFKIPKALQIPFLFLYTSLLSWQPPLLRGLSEALVNFSRFKPSNSSLRKLFAGVILLLLFPKLLLSRSFVMSWTAALCTGALSAKDSSFRAAVKSQTLMYLFLSPMLLGFAPLHPISIICNLLLAPVIAFFIFPLAVYACLFPNLSFLFDHSMQLLRLTLENFKNFSLIPQEKPLSLFWCWSYLGILQLVFYFRERQNKATRS